MMSAKIPTPGILKITLFWNKGYDIILSVDDTSPTKFYHVIQIIL